MAYTQTQIDSLRKAIASGALTVRHGDTLTTFRDLNEMKRILSEMEEEVNGSGTTGRRRTYARFNKGVD